MPWYQHPFAAGLGIDLYQVAPRLFGAFEDHKLRRVLQPATRVRFPGKVVALEDPVDGQLGRILLFLWLGSLALLRLFILLRRIVCASERYQTSEQNQTGDNRG